MFTVLPEPQDNIQLIFSSVYSKCSFRNFMHHAVKCNLDVVLISNSYIYIVHRNMISFTLSLSLFKLMEKQVDIYDSKVCAHPKLRHFVMMTVALSLHISCSTAQLDFYITVSNFEKPYHFSVMHPSHVKLELLHIKVKQ